MLENKTLLGLDMGTRYIGVAVGQTITMTATPLRSLSVKEGIPDWENLDQLVLEWEPHAFVMGMPMKLEQKNHDISLFIKALSEKIKERYSIPIFWVNEDLTTVEAKSRLFSQKGYRGLSKENIDCYAAKLILEDWLATAGHKDFKFF